MSEVLKCDAEYAHDADYPCSHDVRIVHVMRPGGTDWGEFAYCQNAIDEDERRGFLVIEMEVARG